MTYKIMKRILSYLCTTGLIIAQTTCTHTSYIFSTVWTIHNQTPVQFAIDCVSPPPKGLITGLTMEVIAEQNSVIHYRWGDAFYNDGMGLNPGYFTCMVWQQENGRENQNKQTIRFNTGWGEAVILSITKQYDSFIIKKINKEKL